jgi:TonB-dependent receptor
MYTNKIGSRRDVVLSGLALSLASLPTMAQSTGDESVEEVVVLGSYAQSLKNAIDKKRNADGVVDAITAEDIGKYPDTNLAESLARITGVSIDRFNGEGSRVTVRGLGPDFNLVTLNGRSMPTVGGRSFDFADISPHGIAAVEVYKTGNAAIPTGGIGATINMVTTKPLDAPGFVGVVEASALDAYSVKGDDYTPQIMGIFSNTFADDTIGVSLSASHQVRHNREEQARVDNWRPNVNPTDPNAVWENNNKRADGTTWYPQNAGYNIADNETERTNAQFTLQWQPSDDVRATLDYTHSDYKFFGDRRGLGIWFNGFGSTTQAVTNERGTYTFVEEAGGDYAVNIGAGGKYNENNSVGINLEWNASDSLTVTFDAHDSDAEGKGDPKWGSDTYMITGNTSYWGDAMGEPTANINRKSANYYSSGVHRWTFDLVGGQEALLPSDLGTLFLGASDYYSSNDMSQYQLSGLWENQDDSALKSVKFGVSKSEQEWINQSMFSGQLPAGWWGYSESYVPDDAWVANSLAGWLSDAANSGNYGVTYYWDMPVDLIAHYYETMGFADAEGVSRTYDGPGGGPIAGWYCCYAGEWGPDYRDAEGYGHINAGPIDTDARVMEENTSYYIQADFETEFNGMPVDVVTGLRYETSDVTAAGLETPIVNIAWVGGNEFSYIQGEKDFTTGYGDNKFFLPSIDAKVGISDDEIVRFSYSRTITRPGIGSLRSTTDFPGTPKIGQRKANVGNTELLPYVSDNIDVTYENYYAEGSYFAISYWRKVVDNFLQSRTTQESVNGIRDVYFGQAADACRASIVAEGNIATDPLVYACLTAGAAGVSLLPDGDDPLALFDVTREVNEETGTLYGFELAAQHLFEDGYGITANYTTVNGDVEADRDAIGYQFALTGMSDSANLSGFYETDRYSVRLSWNWRDEFLGGFDQHSSPVFTEEYEQWDLNATYNLNDNAELFVQGLNLTEEVVRTYVRYPEQLLALGQYGTTWVIGGRYRF